MQNLPLENAQRVEFLLPHAGKKPQTTGDFIAIWTIVVNEDFAVSGHILKHSTVSKPCTRRFADMPIL